MRFSWAWWRFRILEFAVALVILMSVLYLSDYIRMRQRADVPAANWFTVNDIYVPDFKLGENPTMTYDRSIKEPFRGFWVIELERFQDDGKTVLECTGSGVNDYEVADFLPRNSVTFEWFIGRKCPSLSPGNYRMRGSWKMKRDGWPDKQIIRYSNVFKITK
jgi:hypothetical protein